MCAKAERVLQIKMSDHRINCYLQLTLQEQESLMRLKTMEYLATSTITLTSLAQLLGKISNMVINDHIQEQVEQALEAIHQVRERFICDRLPGSTCGILRCGAITKLERGTMERVLKGGVHVY